MTRDSARRLQIAAVLVFAALGAGFGAWLGQHHRDGTASPLDRIEALTLDWRQTIAGPRPPPSDVVILAIDDAAITEFGGFPIPRERLAGLVEALTAAGARAIAVDLLLLEPGDPAADERLAAALAAGSTVIAAAGIFPGTRADSPARPPRGVLRDPRVPSAQRVLWPAEPFQSAAHLGLVNVTIDAGGTPRHIPLLFGDRGGLAPSLVLATAIAATGADPVLTGDAVEIAGVRQPLDLGYHLALHPYGPRGTIATVSAADLATGRIRPADFKEKIVLIGATALGAGDVFPIAFHRTVPGVEILATGVANLLRGEGLDRGPAVRRLDARAAMVLPVLVVLALAWRRTAMGLAIVAAIFASWVVAAFIAFTEGIWLSVAVPLAAAVPTAALFGAVSFWMSRRSVDALTESREALERLQSPLLARRLAEDPDFLARPVTQPGVILFFDVSGFTGFSEAIGPELTRNFQSELMDIVADTVTDLGGGLITFLGDGAMVVFGLPAPRPDDAARALVALDALDRGFTPWLAQWSADAPQPLTMIYGLQAGPIVVSRLGGHTQQTVTVAGDTVNVANRLMEVAKARGTRAAVGEAVFDAARAAGDTSCRGADTADIDRVVRDYSPHEDVEIRGRKAPERIRFRR